MVNGNAIESYHDRERSDVLSLVPAGSMKVLDVGGGIGANLAYLKEQGVASRVVLVDLVADEHLPSVDASYGGNLEDPKLINQIGTDEGPFDAILCLDVLEHLTDPWSMVAACHRMLRPGGVIVASIPNMRHLSLVVPLVFKGEFALEDAGIRDRTHLRWFVEDTAKALMTSSGLHLEHCEGRSYSRKHKLIAAASFGLLRHFTYLQYFIVVRRPSEAD